MTALDMLDDSYPHGTVDGYTQGCRTNHCPAPIRCHEVRTRYASDWAFRKRVDAGWTVEEIVAADVVEREAAKVTARATARREREKARTKAKRTTRTARSDGKRTWTVEDVESLRRMTAACVTDVEIAERLGRSKHAVHTKRNELGMRRPDREKTIPHGSYAGYAAGCRTDCPSTVSCHDAAKAYWRDQAEARRRADDVPAAYTDEDRRKVLEVFVKSGGNRSEVARRLGMGRKLVGKIVRAAA